MTIDQQSERAVLPDGWKLHYLGRPSMFGWCLAQITKIDPSDYDGVSFISRTGITEEQAYDEALSALRAALTE